MFLKLDWETVEALRNFADELPKTKERMVQDTVDFYNVYNSLSDEVGPHASQFLEMFNHMKNCVKLLEENLDPLEKGLRSTADKIEDYLNDNDDFQNSIGPRVRKR